MKLKDPWDGILAIWSSYELLLAPMATALAYAKDALPVKSITNLRDYDK